MRFHWNHAVVENSHRFVELSLCIIIGYHRRRLRRRGAGSSCWAWIVVDSSFAVFRVASQLRSSLSWVAVRITAVTTFAWHKCVVHDATTTFETTWTAVGVNLVDLVVHPHRRHLISLSSSSRHLRRQMSNGTTKRWRQRMTTMTIFISRKV